MAMVLKRLQGRLQSSLGARSYFALDNVDPLSDSLIARLNKEGMTSTKRAVFTLLVQEDASLVLEYDTLRALLKKVLDTSPATVEDKKARVDQATQLVYELLALADLQDYKYHHYINEHPDLTKRTLRKHLALYRACLNPATYVAAETARVHGLSTLSTNPIRLYLVRGRRFLLSLTPILNDRYNYSSWFIWADAYVAPCLAALGFLFFIPRLIYNLERLCGTPIYDRFFNCNKLQPESTALVPFVRFKTQWHRLWPNLVNDVAWVASGFLLYYVLIGTLQPLAIYLSVAIQFYDVIMVSIRAYYELSRLNTLLQDHKILGLNYQYVACLEKNIQCERSMLALGFANAFVLFCAIGLALPVVAALHPLLPLIGACIAICMTVMFFEGSAFFNVFKRQYDTNDFDKQLGGACKSAALQNQASGQITQNTNPANPFSFFQSVQEPHAPRAHYGQQQHPAT